MCLCPAIARPLSRWRPAEVLLSVASGSSVASVARTADTLEGCDN